jgi:acetyl esterase/lipase
MTARDSGLPAPACIWAISPWLNMTHEAPSFTSLATKDPVLSRADLEFFANGYALPEQRKLAGVSPLQGDVRGLQPTLIHAGAHEALLDDIQAMHDKLVAGAVDSHIEVWDEMFHCWHLYWPMLEEARRATIAGAGFLRKHCKA